MSPELLTNIITALITALVSSPFIAVTVRKLFKLYSDYKARQIQLELDTQELRLEIERNKAQYAKNEEERDNRQRDILDGFVVEFKNTNKEQADKIEDLNERLTKALIDKAHLDGQLLMLGRNQDKADDKIASQGKRISELEADKRLSETLIADLRIERTELLRKSQDGQNLILSQTIKINQLEEEKSDLQAIIASQNNIKTQHQTVASFTDNKIIEIPPKDKE